MQIEELYRIYREAGAVCTDTRNLIAGSIFFALKGENFNGNKFVHRALSEGCAWAVTDEPPAQPHRNLIEVKNVLVTLQALARYHREQFDIPFIGLTGSNGKTTTKELMAAVLQQKYNVHATKGNLNNHIGVPLTLLSMSGDTEIAIIEMGANQPNDIGELCEICRPTHGMITNIGRAHLEGFGSIDGVARAKGQLFDFLRSMESLVFLNSSDSKLTDMARGIQTFTFSTDNTPAEVRGELTDREITVSFRWRVNEQWHPVRTQMSGSYNLANLMAATAVGCYFKVSPDSICRALENYVPSNNRSQVMKSKHNTVVLDAYNANPTSVEKALLDFSAIRIPGKKLVILGDMLEVGEESLEAHEAVIDFLTEHEIPGILVGPIYQSVLKNQPGFQSFEKVDEAKKYLEQNPVQNCCILVKGSRGIQLEKLTELL